MNKVVFHKCFLFGQELGTNDEYMVSKLFFSLEKTGHVYSDLDCIIKQTVGSDYRKDNFIEVYANIPKSMGVNIGNFQKAARQYYQNLIGQLGAVIVTPEGVNNVRMGNFVMEANQVYSI